MTKQRIDGGTQALFGLIREGNITKVIEYCRTLDKEVVKTALDEKKRTPLHVSAEIGSSQLIDVFLN